MPEPTTTAEQKQPTHRLDRMVVQEVSLVDRAANQRRFLVTKKDDSMPNAVKKDDGTTTSEAGAAAAAGAPAGEGATGAPAMQQQVKEGLTQALATVAEKLIAIASDVDKIEVSDQAADPPVPAAITDEITGALKLLSDVASKFAPAAEPDGAPVIAPEEKVEGAGEDEEPTDAEKSAVVAAEAEIAGKGLELAKHGDVVAKSVATRLSIPLDRASVVVAKVGRRMAKKRLEQLGKAVDMLISLMKELRYESQQRQAQKTQTQKSATPIAPAASSEAVERLLGQAESLVSLAKTQADEIGSLKSALGTANAKLAELSNVVTGSNAIPVEKSSAPVEPVWPSFDMNASKPGSRR